MPNYSSTIFRMMIQLNGLQHPELALMNTIEKLSKKSGRKMDLYPAIAFSTDLWGSG